MRRAFLWTVVACGLSVNLARAFEAVLTRPGDATKDAAAAWKREGFTAVAIVAGSSGHDDFARRASLSLIGCRVASARAASGDVIRPSAKCSAARSTSAPSVRN